MRWMNAAYNIGFPRPKTQDPRPKTQALSSRFDAARHAAVQLLKPNVAYVAIPKRTLNNEGELKVWLAEVEQLLSEKLKDGPVAL